MDVPKGLRKRWQKQMPELSRMAAAALGSNITLLEVGMALEAVPPPWRVAGATPTSVEPLLPTLPVEAEYIMRSLGWRLQRWLAVCGPASLAKLEITKLRSQVSALCHSVCHSPV
jgi:hypothetical protein